MQIINDNFYPATNLLLDAREGVWDSLDHFLLHIDEMYWVEGLSVYIRRGQELDHYRFEGGNTIGHLKLISSSSSIQYSETVPTLSHVRIWVKIPEYDQYELYEEDTKKTWIQTGKLKTDIYPEWYKWFEFLWMGVIRNSELISEIPGYNVVINNNDITTPYIPVASNAEFEFDTTLTALDLVDTDYERLFVKYDNSEPYHIRMMGVIKEGLTQTQINQLHRIFDLWVFWSGEFNTEGVIKQNRQI